VIRRLCWPCRAAARSGPSPDSSVPRRAKGFLLRRAIRPDQHRCGVLTRTRLGASLQTDELRLLPYLRTEHGGQPRRVHRTRDVPAAAGALGQVPESGVAADQRGDRGARRSRLLVRVCGAFPHARGCVSRWAPTGCAANAGGGGGGLAYTMTVTSYFSAMRAVTSVVAPGGANRSAPRSSFRVRCSGTAGRSAEVWPPARHSNGPACQDTSSWT